MASLDKEFAMFSEARGTDREDLSARLAFSIDRSGAGGGGARFGYFLGIFLRSNCSAGGGGNGHATRN